MTAKQEFLRSRWNGGRLRPGSSTGHGLIPHDVRRCPDLSRKTKLFPSQPMDLSIQPEGLAPPSHPNAGEPLPCRPSHRLNPMHSVNNCTAGPAKLSRRPSIAGAASGNAPDPNSAAAVSQPKDRKARHFAELPQYQPRFDRTGRVNLPSATLFSDMRWRFQRSTSPRTLTSKLADGPFSAHADTKIKISAEGQNLGRY